MDGDGRAGVGCSAVGWSGVRVRSILGGWASEDGGGGGGEGRGGVIAGGGCRYSYCSQKVILIASAIPGTLGAKCSCWFDVYACE